MGHRKTMAMLVITRGYLQLITLGGIVRILATTTNAVRDCAPLATRHGTSRPKYSMKCSSLPGRDHGEIDLGYFLKISEKPHGENTEKNPWFIIVIFPYDKNCYFWYYLVVYHGIPQFSDTTSHRWESSKLRIVQSSTNALGEKTRAWLQHMPWQRRDGKTGSKWASGNSPEIRKFNIAIENCHS